MSDLESLLDFIKESEKLKIVERKTRPVGMARYENSAEHSWSLALMAIVLADFANEDIDLLKVLKMLVIHDLPEISTGDVFVYAKNGDHHEEELEAAEKLFSVLPERLRETFLALWEEFEDGETPEARFARALDRFHPCFCNFNNAQFGKTSWQELGISADAVLRKNSVIEEGSDALWSCVQDIVRESQEKGYFPDKKDVKYG